MGQNPGAEESKSRAVDVPARRRFLGLMKAGLEFGVVRAPTNYKI